MMINVIHVGFNDLADCRICQANEVLIKNYVSENVKQDYFSNIKAIFKGN